MFERDLPGENKGGHSRDAKVGKLPLETCDTINGAWGYNADDKNFKSVPDLIRYLVRAAGRDANFLLERRPAAGRHDRSGIGRSGSKASASGWRSTGTRSTARAAGRSRRSRGASARKRRTRSICTFSTRRPPTKMAGLSSRAARAWTPTTFVSVADDSRVESRTDPNGQLAVKLDTPSDAIDVVLQVAK